MMIQNKAFQMMGPRLLPSATPWKLNCGKNKKHTKMVATTYSNIPFKAYFDRHSNTISLRIKKPTWLKKFIRAKIILELGYNTMDHLQYAEHLNSEQASSNRY